MTSSPEEEQSKNEQNHNREPPVSEKALLGAALQLHQAGRHAEAEAMYQQILAANPNQPHALHYLGVLRSQTGACKEAVSLLQKAVSLCPKEATVHFSLGTAFRALGDPAEAANSYREALCHRSPYPEAEAALETCLGLIAKSAKQHAKAEEHFRSAVKRNPQDVQLLVNLADALRLQKKYDDAEQVIANVTDKHPTIAEAQAIHGSIYTDQGQSEKAIPHLSKALRLKPDLLIANERMGIEMAATGEIQQAKQYYQRALAANRKNPLTFYNLALVEHFSENDPLLETMRNQLEEEEMSIEDRMHLYFAFGKIHKDWGQHDEAFRCWTEGNRLKRRTLIYTIEAERQFVSRLKSVFTEELLSKFSKAGCASRLPIFIVGMPRSGTTLVEQILAAHPDVYGAGELADLNRIANSTLKNVAGGRSYPESVAAMSREQIRQLGEEYVEALRTLNTDNPRITDKMPVNFFHLGTIALILPHAKIIHCRRNPIDTCVSCFSTLFVRRSCPFAYDLKELGEFYRLYRELMDHWSSLSQISCLDVQYETLVRNQESATKEILSFCDLPWDSACLDFHRSPRPVHTASNIQIRQPVYTHAIERWRRYEHHLGPLREALGDLDGRD